MPFQIFMGDDAEKKVAELQDMKQVAEVRAEIMLALYESRELRAQAERVTKDINLWDGRVSKLRRLCYLAIGAPGVAALIDVGGHLLGWLR